jgi:hypothetical protein
VSYFLTRPTPIDNWRVVTEAPDEGEVIALPDCQWYSQAQAEADKRNGKGKSEQGVLGL